MTKKKKLIIALSVFAVIIVLYAWGFALKTEKYRITSPKLDGELKIAFVSDLHNCFYGNTNQKKLMKRIDGAQPDIVIFGGDVIDQYGGTKYALRAMKAAAEKYPCFYSVGNHELLRSDLDSFIEDVKALGIHVLAGDSSAVEVRGQKVRVYGIYGVNYRNHLQSCLSELDESSYNILLAHEPTEYDDLLADNENLDFDLILSGHAHGGQWRLPVILEQGLYAPDQGFFPKYTSGMYERGGRVQIISRGLARPLRMIFIPRIFDRPELSIITVSGK